MPIHEYQCRACGATFETLVRDAAPVVCQSCGSADLERLLSMFGVATESTSSAARDRARKEQRAANKDRIIAQREAMERHQH